MSLARAGVAVVVASLLAAGCGDDGGSPTDSDTTSAGPTSLPADSAPSPSTPSSPSPTDGRPASPDTDEVDAAVHVIIPDHPYWSNPVAVASPAALDELATAHVTTLDDADPQMERFLFGSVPITVFDEIFETVTPQRRSELFWMLHLSGYFGGRWLRGQIAEAQPDALLVGFSEPPTEEAFDDTMRRAGMRLDTLDGGDASIVAAARAALFDSPATEAGGEPIRGLADSFGYNRGYMLEILASPPEGVAASPQYEVSCGGLFDCRYASPKLAVLPELAERQAELNSDDPSDPQLVSELLAIQEGAEPRGRGVWSGGLSVQGFSQESYDQLLDVSSSFLETVQAAALVNVGAVVDDDVVAARTGIVAEAAMIVWLDAYIAGLTNGEGEIELPTFG